MKPNDKAIEAALAEGKRWQEGSSRRENQIPSWKVLREAADKGYGFDVIAKFNNREERDEALERLRAEAMVDAAYAAQFQSEGYAGLLRELRNWGAMNYKICNDAADAIEAAERERCAKIADDAQYVIAQDESIAGYNLACAEIAATIRSGK